ncbi:hypothetical protein DFJ74DRAFT_762901 [Hyaloraphidium curvatum]|nr:hypothetical protein DFJ74DRAFT_762901 [Hyaloraphidium curvatum]
MAKPAGAPKGGRAPRAGSFAKRGRASAGGGDDTTDETVSADHRAAPPAKRARTAAAAEDASQPPPAAPPPAAPPLATPVSKARAAAATPFTTKSSPALRLPTSPDAAPPEWQYVGGDPASHPPGFVLAEDSDPEDGDPAERSARVEALRTGFARGDLLALVSCFPVRVQGGGWHTEFDNDADIADWEAVDPALLRGRASPAPNASLLPEIASPELSSQPVPKIAASQPQAQPPPPPKLQPAPILDRSPPPSRPHPTAFATGWRTVEKPKPRGIPVSQAVQPKAKGKRVPPPPPPVLAPRPGRPAGIKVTPKATSRPAEEPEPSSADPLVLSPVVEKLGKTLAEAAKKVKSKAGTKPKQPEPEPPRHAAEQPARASPAPAHASSLGDTARAVSDPPRESGTTGTLPPAPRAATPPPREGTPSRPSSPRARTSTPTRPVVRRLSPTSASKQASRAPRGTRRATLGGGVRPVAGAKRGRRRTEPVRGRAAFEFSEPDHDEEMPDADEIADDDLPPPVPAPAPASPRKKPRPAPPDHGWPPLSDPYFFPNYPSPAPTPLPDPSLAAGLQAAAALLAREAGYAKELEDAERREREREAERVRRRAAMEGDEEDELVAAGPA